MENFLKERLDSKLGNLDPSDSKYAELIARFTFTTWIDNATRRVGQIQAATHTLKSTHPDAKASSLYVLPKELTELLVVGTHSLGEKFEMDVDGNAAVLDIYKFLKLKHEKQNLLALVLNRDTDLAAALSKNPLQAEAWMSSFAELMEPLYPISSHALAKQLYWLTGNYSRDDSSFHLLAPLHASSLTHAVYLTIQNDRFSEEAKAARQAKKDGVFSERPVREYPQMAIQNLGGTKPQNVSQLNSERRGDNFLLASLPPSWRSVDLKPLLGVETMFHQYGRRPQVRKTIRTLLAFLKTDPTQNIETRTYRDELVQALIEEFLQFSAELRSLLPGWSQTPQCQLGIAQQHWLDSNGLEQAYAESSNGLPTDTPERISEQFANWLNKQLHDPLPMDDATFLHWRNLLREQIKEEEREGHHEN